MIPIALPGSAPTVSNAATRLATIRAANGIADGPYMTDAWGMVALADVAARYNATSQALGAGTPVNVKTVTLEALQAAIEALAARPTA